MLAAFIRSLQAARSFSEVQDGATAALQPALQQVRQLDPSQLVEALTLYGGEPSHAPPRPCLADCLVD